MFFRAASFTTFRFTLSSMTSSSSGHPTTSQLFLSGAMTGLVIAFVETPIDLVKTKLQVQIFGSQLNPEKFKAPIYTTAAGCVRYTVNKHGMRALWQGLGATLIRNVPANALFFPGTVLISQTLFFNTISFSG
jgi:solute carrier family 25 carnitine/acylcarnitine transporter 20/29